MYTDICHLRSSGISCVPSVIYLGYGVGTKKQHKCKLYSAVGQDSSVGIATHYGLEGPGIESQWGRDFLHLSGPALGPCQSPVQWVPVLFPGGKAARAWR